MSDLQVQPLFPDREPDFNRLLTVFERSGIPDRVPFIELFADPEISAAVLDDPVIYPSPVDTDQQEAALLQRIRFCRKVGLDYVWAYPAVNFAGRQFWLVGEDSAPLARPARIWVNEADGLITSMAEYEKHPWPSPENVSYRDIEFVARNLPDGMRVLGTTSGVLEWVMWMMGFVPFSMALYDEPELIEAMFQRIGDIFASVYEVMAEMPSVGAMFLGDDMGYKQGTFIRPDLMRKYVFPQQKRLIDITHRHGKPFLLHACGELSAVMDDLIGIGIDGKHSFEDTYLHVVDAKRLYGDRISILGGVDVDFLVRSSEDDVRAYTRRVLEGCMPGGGYGLGTGNSVANYIPVRNYLAMLDEGNKVGHYS
jgi:uroporphyrinogen decarboxylase